ncbi:hypothetical protein ACFL36_06895 [Thermodesulfobacteriota bacterium]
MNLALTCGTSSAGNNKYCGSGAVSSTHSDVAALLSFDGFINGFACKAGNVSGSTFNGEEGVICTLYKDNGTDADGQTTGVSCTTDSTGTCVATINGQITISALDSISIRTTGISGSVGALSGSVDFASTTP